MVPTTSLLRCRARVGIHGQGYDLLRVTFRVRLRIIIEVLVKFRFKLRVMVMVRIWFRVRVNVVK